MHFHNSFVFLIFVGQMLLRIKDDVESVLQYQLDFYLEFSCVMYEFDFFICGICRDFPNFSSLFGVFRNWWVFHNHSVKRNLRTLEVLLSSLFHHNTTSTEFIYLFVGNFLFVTLKFIYQLNSKYVISRVVVVGVGGVVVGVLVVVVRVVGVGGVVLSR